MNKSESKYFNTAIKMNKAFLKLLNKYEFDYITVKDICNEAGVNRSTFYLHYETINDLLEESMNYINTQYMSYFKDINFDINNIDSLPLEELYLITPKYVTPWVTFIKENKKLFQLFLKRRNTLKLADGYEDMFNNVIEPILKRYSINKENQEYLFLFYVEGIMGIIKHWLREGCFRSVEEIVSLIMYCVKNYEYYINH